MKSKLIDYISTSRKCYLLNKCYIKPQNQFKLKILEILKISTKSRILINAILDSKKITDPDISENNPRLHIRIISTSPMYPGPL